MRATEYCGCLDRTAADVRLASIGKNAPGDPGELIGERDREHVTAQPLPWLLSRTSDRLRPALRKCSCVRQQPTKIGTKRTCHPLRKRGPEAHRQTRIRDEAQLSATNALRFPRLVVSRIFRTLIMRRLRFQIAAADRVVACSCSIWPTTLFRRCAVVALPPG